MSIKTGVELIALERGRHITVEDWSAEHDDGHVDEQLARAAACYALPSWVRRFGGEQYGAFSYLANIWPWDLKWWKPTPDDRKRELAKAGALCAAEIDRLIRAEREKWISEVAQILATKHGSEKPNGNLKAYAQSMAESYYDDDEDRMTPSEAVDEEISCS